MFIFTGKYWNVTLLLINAHICSSNHPQMVRLHKCTSDFDIADIRDSFMRQYCTPQLNLVMDTAENNDENQLYLKTLPVSLVKSPKHGGRSGGIVEKHTGVSAVIR